MQMTVTFELPDTSVERGMQLATQLMSEEAGLPDRALRVLRVQCEEDIPVEPPPQPETVATAPRLSRGALIQRRRRRIGLTQAQLARLARVGVGTVGRIERGETTRLGPTYLDIVDALRRAERRGNRR